MKVDNFSTKFLSKMFERLGRRFLWFSKKIYQSPQAKRVRPWSKVNGDKTLRLDYDLDDESIVFDVGGYEGQWASDIFSRCCCAVHVFEPVEQYANKIEQRFFRNEKIHVHRIGLSNENKTIPITLSQDGSSFYKTGEKQEDAQVVRVVDFLRENNIDSIDLMKINIEGGEYDLLESLIDSGFINKIQNIQVQFHDFVPDAKQRMESIQAELSKTHFLTYQYEFVWENWKLK